MIAPPDPAVRAAVMSAFLRSGRHLDHASSVVFVVSVLLILPQLPSTVAIAVLVAAAGAALGEKYYAWRVSLDAGLFAVLHAHPGNEAVFDAALAECLGRAAGGPARPLEDRWRGARHLLRLQFALGVLQCLAIVAPIAIGVLPLGAPGLH